MFHREPYFHLSGEIPFINKRGPFPSIIREEAALFICHIPFYSIDRRKSSSVIALASFSVSERQ